MSISCSAMTEPKLTLTPRSSMAGTRALISAPSAERLGADIVVDQNGEQDDEAEEDLEPVGVDAGVEDAHLDKAEDQRAEQHADDRAVAAGQQHAADDGRDDRLELLEQAARRVGGARLHDLDGGEQAWRRRPCR